MQIHGEFATLNGRDGAPLAFSVFYSLHIRNQKNRETLPSFSATISFLSSWAPAAGLHLQQQQQHCGKANGEVLPPTTGNRALPFVSLFQKASELHFCSPVFGLALHFIPPTPTHFYCDAVRLTYAQFSLRLSRFIRRRSGAPPLHHRCLFHELRNRSTTVAARLSDGCGESTKARMGVKMTESGPKFHLAG